MIKLNYDQELDMFICGGSGIEFTSQISANQPLIKTSLVELYFPSKQSSSGKTNTTQTTDSSNKDQSTNSDDKKITPPIQYGAIPKFLQKTNQNNIVFVSTPYSEGVIFHNYKEIFLCGHVLKDSVQTLHKVPVFSETDNSIVQIVTCRHSMFVLLSNGKMYSLRGNEMVVYLDQEKRALDPKCLLQEIPFDKPIKYVSNGGGKHFFAQTTDNELYAIGDDTFGQLCLSKSSIRSHNGFSNNTKNVDERKELDDYESTTFYPKFVKVPIDKTISMQDNEIEKIECGLNHTFILIRNVQTGAKSLYSSGCSYYGQTAIGSTRNRNRLSQVELNCSNEIIDIKCNNNGSYVITPRALFYAGINDQNILSVNKAYSSVLTEVPLTTQIASNDEFSIMECGYNHCLAVTKRNRIFGFGRSSSNQFGIGLNNYICQEIETKELFDKKIVAICCGHSHSIIFSQPLVAPVEDEVQLHEDLIKLRSSSNVWDLQIFTASKDFSVKIPLYILSKRRPELLSYNKSKAPKSKDSLLYLIDWIYFNTFIEPSLQIDSLIDVLEWMTVNNVQDESLTNLVLNESIIRTNEENVYDTIQYILNRKYPKEESPLSAFWHHALSFCKQYIVENSFCKIKNSSFLKQSILVEIAKLEDPNLLECRSLSEVQESLPQTIPEIVSEIFDSPQLSDLQIVLDKSRGFVVYCHKSILETRSNYFNMKKYGFQAATINEIDVSCLFTIFKKNEDITFEDFINLKSLLKYLYTGRIEITTKNALTLMLLWEAMGMSEKSPLFETCKDFVCRGLCIENIMNVITKVVNREKKSTPTESPSMIGFGIFRNLIQEEESHLQPYNYSIIETECLNFCANKWKEILLIYKHDILNFLSKEQLLKITCIQNRVSL
ncbi:RCC1 domain-containing protein [Naegleria gruberi]|uniref:RCC1 domain-containing protein n=1 Tax=Naegleria gruberi TaxID=5762 RepID=D2V8R1_NAEGR|nr:RCC1 domain-containing protein [Naegleria gruberi]EFC46733.1 RCC1 domain-containing protein [Naegleria gruberi]|eukprot:XP_002679477.1 RCC1 domain-containing protein [Naegleria gruberi strain NEG-M]